MPTTRKTTSKTKTGTAKRTSSRSFKISFQKPGVLPESVSVKKDTTLGDFVSSYNLEGYVVSLNGSTAASNSTILQKDDVIRIGIKDKNA